MRFSARSARLLMVALGFCVAGEAATPARAQFFFPFFDNRPSKRPDADFWGRRRDDDSAPQRLRPRPHREKPRAAEGKKPKVPEAAKGQTVEAKASDAPVVEGPPPPYEPQLLRLSEIMGALTYLQTICGANVGKTSGAEPWREQMENLMNAEAAGPSRREKLAGAYNRGLQGYQFSYHACTSNAQLARQRFLDEGGQLAHDISARFRAN